MDTYNGVVIEGKPYTTYYYKIGEKDYSKGEEQVKLAEEQVNLLVGADQEKWVETEMVDDIGDSHLTYGMYNDKFRRYVSDGYINYNRAYLWIPENTSRNAKELGFEGLGGEEATTSIQIRDLTTDDRVYDLNGIKVDNPRKGIFISKGRKFSLIR